MDGEQSTQDLTVPALAFDLDGLVKKFEQYKVIARQTEKKSEVARHKSPQIKRSVGFLMDVKNEVEDVTEVIDKLKCRNLEKESQDLVLKMEAGVKKISQLVEGELLANAMASKSLCGWRTVKNFEQNPLFSGEDAEAQTKKFRQAEFQAIKDGQRFRKRPSYSNFKSKLPYQRRVEAAAGSAEASVQSAAPALARTCFKCGLPGHFKRECKN